MPEYAHVVISPLRCAVCDDVLPNITFVVVQWVDIGPGGDQHNEHHTVVHNRDKCINIMLERARRETWDGKLKEVRYE